MQDSMNKKTQDIIDKWVDFLAPEGMTSKENAILAKSAGLSPDTVSRLRKRTKRSINTDTLIRLFLARGVTKEQLLDFERNTKSKIDQSELEWNRFGRKLKSNQRVRFVKLIEYLMKRWGLK